MCESPLSFTSRGPVMRTALPCAALFALCALAGCTDLAAQPKARH